MTSREAICVLLLQVLNIERILSEIYTDNSNKTELSFATSFQDVIYSDNKI